MERQHLAGNERVSAKIKVQLHASLAKRDYAAYAAFASKMLALRFRRFF